MKLPIPLTALLLQVGIFLAATQPVLAEQVALNRVTSMLVKMRVDEQLSAQVEAMLKRGCATALEVQREKCRVRSTEILREIDDNKKLAQLMTPYFERNYTEAEIEALSDFFGSPDGRVFTDVTIAASAYRIDGQWPESRSLRPIDADTQRRLDHFLTSGVGRKYAQSVMEYKQELNRQSLSYVCGILERHGPSCGALGIGPGKLF